MMPGELTASAAEAQNSMLGAGRARIMLISVIIAAIAWAAAMVAPEPAQAAYGDGVAIRAFESYPSTSQAGGHPDFTIGFENDTQFDPIIDHPCRCNSPKDIIVNTPAGLIGNPHSAPRCDAERFAFDECPMDSQIGVATPSACLTQVPPGNLGSCGGFVVPLYNLVPPPHVPGLIGFKALIFNSPIVTLLTARTGGDYGLRATVPGLQNSVAVGTFVQQIWGVPADPVNDDLRFKTTPILAGDFDVGYASNSPRTPFMTNPTACGEDSLETTIEIIANDGGVTHASTPWPATTGCSLLSFDPSLSANPTTTQADTSSGIDVNLTVPQPQSPETPSPSAIRATTVKLPVGFSVNPNAADGKTSCSDAAARFGTEDEALCPEHAKVGTLEIHSAVLPGVLPGAVYLGEPLPGHRYRLFLVADGFGLHIKLPGEAVIDRQTGQITVSFQDLPQTPFEEFKMHFFGSERGLMATPDRCGAYPVVSTFTPWNSALPAQTSTQLFEITTGPGGAPCPGVTRPFNPAFQAASAGNTGGEHTPFAVNLQRPDGDQNLLGLDVTTPPGFSGTLRGIPYCPEAAISQLSSTLYTGLAELAMPSCPVASLLGDAVAGAGAGSHPLHTPGKVYLAGPYKGAPLSLVVVVPAVSGPYDLGNVAVRARIEVDPRTAQVTTASDPLPQILEGIPLRARSIRVNLNRPGFARNPTNCRPMAVQASIIGTEGAVANRSAHYEAANCANLPFDPNLKLRLKGGTKRTAHPSLRATVTTKPGEANLASTVVALPRTVLLDNAHIGTVCTRVQFAASSCPAGSVYGHARAFTPQLDEPLEGPVYLRSSTNELPDLVADLEGQIDIELVGRIDSVRGGIRTTFSGIPDASVSKFILNMKGGKKGLLFNGVNICRERKPATVRMRGQNGRRTASRASLHPSCGKTRKAKRSRHLRLDRQRGAR